MPLASNNNLDELYAMQRLLQSEVKRLQHEYDRCEAEAAADRCYLLTIEMNALQEEATQLTSRISDILERDLQR
jgi:uncharacterized protein (DUF3084 family)